MATPTDKVTLGSLADYLKNYSGEWRGFEKYCKDDADAITSTVMQEKYTASHKDMCAQMKTWQDILDAEAADTMEQAMLAKRREQDEPLKKWWIDQINARSRLDEMQSEDRLHRKTDAPTPTYIAMDLARGESPSDRAFLDERTARFPLLSEPEKTQADTLSRAFSANWDDKEYLMMIEEESNR